MNGMWWCIASVDHLREWNGNTERAVWIGVEDRIAEKTPLEVILSSLEFLEWNPKTRGRNHEHGQQQHKSEGFHRGNFGTRQFDSTGITQYGWDAGDCWIATFFIHWSWDWRHSRNLHSAIHSSYISAWHYDLLRLFPSTLKVKGSLCEHVPNAPTNLPNTSNSLPNRFRDGSYPSNQSSLPKGIGQRMLFPLHSKHLAWSK